MLLVVDNKIIGESYITKLYNIINKRVDTNRQCIKAWYTFLLPKYNNK